MIHSTIDLKGEGRQVGYLSIPRSHNTGGWSGQWIPIGTLSNRSGPRVLILGGNHGDEYEGQLIARNFLEDTNASDVSGTVIVIPCLSADAAAAGTRLWPDGTNFNRAFPGDPDGVATSALADYLTTSLFPEVDIVIDMHSGGRSLTFAPMSHMHLVEDLVQRKAMLEAMLAWNTTHHMLYTDVAGSGLLPSEAERQGKIVVTTELGGGGITNARTLQVGADGLRNVLRHFGVLAGDFVTRKDLDLDEGIIIDATDPTGYVPVVATGFFEPALLPGEPVSGGQTLGYLHTAGTNPGPRAEVRAPFQGILAAIREFPPVLQGDVVAVVGTRISVSETMSV